MMNSTWHSKIRKMSPQLKVTDIDRAVHFYTKKLGFDIDFRYQDYYVSIIKDNYTIHLKSIESLNNKKEKENETDKKNIDLDIVFAVEGIEDLYTEISSKTVTMIQPFRRMPYGKEFYIADPDGNILGFVEET